MQFLQQVCLSSVLCERHDTSLLATSESVAWMIRRNCLICQSLLNSPTLPLLSLTALLCTSFVNVSVSPSDWLTVRAASKAQCQGAAAVNVNFTQDIQTACFLPLRVSENCQELQERALEALTPWGMSVSHVGRVGDPDPSMISEWVPIVNNGVEESTVVSVHMYLTPSVQE